MQYLTGNWREEHLYNLASALMLYDAVQDRIAAYERKINEKLDCLAFDHPHDQDPPRHTNPAKEKPIRGRG